MTFPSFTQRLTSLHLRDRPNSQFKKEKKKKKKEN